MVARVAGSRMSVARNSHCKRRTAQARLATAKCVIWRRSLSTVTRTVGLDAAAPVRGRFARAQTSFVASGFARRIRAHFTRPARAPSHDACPQRERGRVISGNLTRRYLPLCLLVTPFWLLTGCGNRRAVHRCDRRRHSPKRRTRFIQGPGTSRCSSTSPGALRGRRHDCCDQRRGARDNLTGTFTNSNGFGLSGC